MKFFQSILSRIKKFNRRTKVILAVAVILSILFYLSLPSSLFDAPTSFVIEDRDGHLLSASIAADGQWRFPYNENVPDKFVKCIITFEDKRFYSHPGLDPIAIGRAVVKNISGSGIVQGGSTITMQTVRLSRQKKKRNIWQKVIEATLALRIECRYSKADIMALYASNAPFGTNIVGLDAAAWRYYGRSPQQLSWGEMAALAVVPNSPSLVRPGRNNRRLLAKRNALLDALVKNKSISALESELAKLEPLPAEPLPLPAFAPHLLERFRKDVRRNGGATPTRLKTTVDQQLQINVAALVQQHHDLLKGNGINNACALVLEVETGATLAYVGNVKSTNVEMESYVDVIAAPRSPGSTLKPFLYAAMLSDGMILPNTIIPDIPTQIGGYAPRNFDQEYDGAVSASSALSRSLNVPAVRMLQQYKHARFYELLKNTGLTTLNKPADHYGLSLVLGGSEVRMWDLAGVYASIARSVNHQHENMGILHREDFHAPVYAMEVREVDPGIKKHAISLDVTSAWFALQAMQEVMRPGEEGLWQQFSSSKKIAWKTGTSFGFRDGWAIGVTPKYVVAVWTGNTDGEGRPGLIGIQTAAPLMFDIFRMLPSSPWFREPLNNFSYQPVCRQSGFRANMDCWDVDTVMVPVNSYRSPLCPYHQLIHLDRSATYRVNENCELPSSMLHQSWFVLTPGMEWFYKQKHHDYKTLPAYKPGCSEPPGTRKLELIYPTGDARIYVPLEIDGQKGRTVFMAAHRKASSKIFWSLDGNFLITTSNFHKVELSPAPGIHMITLVDEEGESLSRKFEIIEKEQ